MTTKLVSLDGPLVDLLLDVAAGRFLLPALQFADLRAGAWADHQLDGFRGHLALRDRTLRLALADPDGEPFGQLRQMMDIRNQPIHLELADGSTVDADLAHMPELSICANVDLYHWTWRSSELPRFWYGYLGGRIPRGGNLARVEHSSRWRRNSSVDFRFEGTFDWHLLRGVDDDSHRVILDTHDRFPTREALVRDIMCLEFTLGTPLRLQYFVGIDSDRRPVAAISVGHLARHGDSQRAPVYSEDLDAPVWAPEFFRLLARKILSEGLDPLLLAISSYLDAETDHLDGAYLKAQVGLEAFAKRLVGRGAAKLLVRDEDDWRNWVQNLVAEIAARLLDASNIETVRSKFIGAMYEPSGQLVKRAFLAHGLDLPREVLAEVKKRNYPAHGLLMNAELDHDLDADVRRLEMIQTLIAALVSYHIGYHGPLTGYDVDDAGGRPSPAWWPVALQEDEVAITYVAKRWVSEQIANAELDHRHERIAQAAYYRWLSRGGGHGRDFEDWLEAERTI